MRRRQFVRTIAGASGSLFLPASIFGANAAAGSSAGGAHSRIAEQVQKLTGGSAVTLNLLLPQGSEANLRPIIGRFAQSTGVSVELDQVPVDQTVSRILLGSYSADKSSDIAVAATFGIPDLVEANAIREISEYAEEFGAADYYENSLYKLGDGYKGRLYGYQTDGDAYLMFYNRRWLEDPEARKRFADQFGYELAIPQTWQQLDAQLQFFHEPSKGRFGGALFRSAFYTAWEFWVRFHSKGFWPFDAEMKPQIANDAGVEALSELLSASQYLYPDAKTNGLFENWEAFSKGNIFCNIGWGGTQKYLRGEASQVKNDLAYSATPGGIVDGKLIQVPYFNWGWNYTIPKRSKHSKIAYLFMLYACSPEISTTSVREQGGFFDPFHEVHYKDPDIINVYSNEFLEQHRNALVNSIPDLYLHGQSIYFASLRENIELASSNSIPVSQALKLIEGQWERTTKQLGRESQIKQWQYLRSLYPQSLREMLS